DRERVATQQTTDDRQPSRTPVALRDEQAGDPDEQRQEDQPAQDQRPEQRQPERRGERRCGEDEPEDGRDQGQNDERRPEHGRPEHRFDVDLVILRDAAIEEARRPAEGAGEHPAERAAQDSEDRDDGRQGRGSPPPAGLLPPGRPGTGAWREIRTVGRCWQAPWVGVISRVPPGITALLQIRGPGRVVAGDASRPDQGSAKRSSGLLRTTLVPTTAFASDTNWLDTQTPPPAPPARFPAIRPEPSSVRADWRPASTPSPLRIAVLRAMELASCSVS